MWDKWWLIKHTNNLVHLILFTNIWVHQVELCRVNSHQEAKQKSSREFIVVLGAQGWPVGFGSPLLIPTTIRSSLSLQVQRITHNLSDFSEPSISNTLTNVSCLLSGFASLKVILYLVPATTYQHQIRLQINNCIWHTGLLPECKPQRFVWPPATCSLAWLVPVPSAGLDAPSHWTASCLSWKRHAVIPTAWATYRSMCSWGVVLTSAALITPGYDKSTLV